MMTEKCKGFMYFYTKQVTLDGTIITLKLDYEFLYCYMKFVRHQVSLPYRTTGKIIVLCILIFKFLDSR
jgi:hypothetical protein